ncbi:MAG: translation elongation factor Ts [Acholeplasmataceae bacterium]
MISAKQVKELRDRTGAGMMDCKKALEHCNGNISEAVDYLREKGIAKAAKKSGRIAAEGLCNAVVNGNQAVIYEINAETDFVSKNARFLELVRTVGRALIESDARTTEEALRYEHEGKTLETHLKEATATIGERITMRRVSRLEKSEQEGFGSYVHMGGRIAVLVRITKDLPDVAKDIAMHVAANSPKYLDRTKVDPETIEHEKRVLTQQALAEGKPEKIVEKMVVGRLNKYLQEICLVDQPFVKDTDIKVSQYLKNNRTDVIEFIRLEVGEGIEKKEEDFAAEVMAQVNK